MHNGVLVLVKRRPFYRSK